jgi:hypothetical protein
MGQLLEGLASAPAAPRVVLVVSHLEALKARVARPLFIDVAPGGNRVRPGGDPPLATDESPKPSGPPAQGADGLDQTLRPSTAAEGTSQIFCAIGRRSAAALAAARSPRRGPHPILSRAVRTSLRGRTAANNSTDRN